MNRITMLLLVIISIMLLISCADEEWACHTSGQSMYSLSSSGELGSASKACSCSEMRSFELRVFGRVDEEALRDDFGCWW